MTTLNSYEHIKVETVAKGRWVSLNNITYKDPKGRKRTWEGIERTTRTQQEADAVCMIAILEDELKKCDCVVLVRQYRPAIHCYTVEFPAGLIHEGETADVAAVREMKEETGYSVTVKSVGPATSIDAGIGNTTVKFAICEVIMDKGFHKDLTMAGDAVDEFIQVMAHPVHTLVEKLEEYSKNGDVVDSRLLCWAYGALRR